METVTLTIKEQPPLYLEAEVFNPDSLASKTAVEIAALPLPMGKTTPVVGDYFTVSGKGGATAAETKVVVNGDLKKVKYIGAHMSAGEVVINGDTDMYVGAWMTGGKITAKGNIGDFAATAMKGGELIVEGNAGNYLAAAYRGDWRGMQGGRIHVKGNVGSDAGTFMMGGEIVIDGDVDVHVMTHADGGKTVIKGNAKSRLGGQMVRGEIYLFGSVDVMMPGFNHVGDVELEVEGVTAKFAEYIGDTGERHPKSKGQLIYGKLYQKK
ncbi:formylmethanofuran dehydrogenase [Methanocalculus chunghsingensis]|uniref:formylmethanofuran dehydrogenase n=1 Tax=Methanocalculus chunghsingensis TaxID=156457 RepID=A0A8J7WAG8_9EURY|nr:formylmethanofuran dehydrogenase subunit C [Methanocalculus chunghsingensis]MBR1369362.1 formylmethanofuran dehydrogenase [Methanocalculus chunghsingensis]